MTVATKTPDFHGRRAIVFDTAATDKDNPEILEHAWLELEQNAGSGTFFLLESPATAEFPGQHSRHETVRPSSLGALATHGLLPEDVAGEPRFSVKDHLGGPNLVLIGHQIDFDWKAARGYSYTPDLFSNGGGPVKGTTSPLDDVPRICTLAMSKRLWPDLDSHKLGAVFFHVRGVSAETRDLVKGAHSAMSDVLMATTILFEILRLRPEIKTWEALWRFSEDSRLPRFWDFGKYGPNGNCNVGNPKGLPLHAARRDSGYLKWCRDTFWEEKPYLVKAINLMERGELAP